MNAGAELSGFPPGPPGGYPPGGYPPGGHGPPPAPPGGVTQPGGFGPPGGYGPPGGFGQPPAYPGGFGAPPPVFAPPRKSGPNLGLIFGIGCGSLLLLGVIGAAIFYFMLRPVATASSDESPAASVASAAPVPSAEPAVEGKLEMQDVRLFPARGSKANVYVIGELVNTGTVPLNAPRAKITLFDASNSALDSTTCGALIVRDLQPNEKVPCFSVVSKATGWKTFKVESEFSKGIANYRPADLKITEVESTSPRSVFGAHKVTGKITNQSNFVAKSVWVVVGLYDGNGKIVGSGKTLVAGNDLEPGSTGRFTVSIYNVADHPKKSLTKVFGYDK